ncbi:MAG: shikimate kinase [Oscillospiraceae bacterium]|nr:shikimate kinase [Oscillospiraceae bacterium]
MVIQLKPYGLLGEKLGHSFSPRIHSRFGPYEYRLFEVPREELGAFLRSGSFAGLNVTIPYKKEVIPYCETLSPLAERIGSVNTVTVDAEGRLHGYNTDYFGFCQQLAKAKINVAGEHCVVIGAGGASATVCVALRDLGARQVTVVTHKENTPEKIASLSDAGILVNTSPVGMYPNNGQSPVDLTLLPSLRGVADLIFNPLKTALLLQAEALGIPCAGGLTMLTAQAKQASELFQGKRIPDSRIPAVTREIRRQCENILLIGMPGSGKSVVGSRIAKKLQKPFVDTDAEIELRAGKSIPQIFEQDGEEAFRRLETQVLADVTARSGCVIATGGGVVTRKENHPLLKQNGRVVFLERPVELLSRKGRPLSSSEEAVKRLYTERFPLYLALCDLRVRNIRTVHETVSHVLRALGYSPAKHPQNAHKRHR